MEERPFGSEAREHIAHVLVLRKGTLNGESGRKVTWVRIPIRPGHQRSGLVVRMNQERCFRQNVNAERATLVESHHHAGVSRDVDHLVCYVTGSRADGSGWDGNSS